MRIADFLVKKKDYLVHLEVEKNLTTNTLRAYAGDLEQFGHFWQRISPQEAEPVTFRRALERFFVALHNNQLSNASLARKISCFQSFITFLESMVSISHGK